MCHLKTFLKYAYHTSGQQLLLISLITKESVFHGNNKLLYIKGGTN